MNNKSPDSANGAERARPESFRARSLSVSFTVKNLQASLAWYRDAVGFTVEKEYERGGKVTAVTLKAGTVQILLGQDDGAKGMDRVKGQGLSVQFTTAQNVDEIAKRIKAHGSTLESEPTDMPWGVRAFRVKDPDGFALVISTERPGT